MKKKVIYRVRTLGNGYVQQGSEHTRHDVKELFEFFQNNRSG